MYIIKRSGTQAEFDNSKIYNAITKANKEVIEKERLSDEEIREIVDEITEKSENLSYSLSVEEVQDSVENAIFDRKKFVLGRAYSQYRFQRALQRQKNTFDQAIISLVNYENEDVKQENSNKKPEIISVQRDYMAGYVSKDLSRKYLLPEDVIKAHDEGIIHFHDMDYYANKLHNCCLVNLEDMLQNGTVLSGVMIDKPHSFSTACTIKTQIMAQVASSQYGGQSMSVAHISPFVDVSRQKIREELKEEWDMLGNDYSSEEGKAKFEKIVSKRLDIEITKGVQTIQYQVLNMQTTNGQAPFITLFMYINEVPDGQAREDQVLVIKEILRQRIQGVKNEKGVWILPVFPKLIYVLDENNTYEGSKYFDVTKLACKCISTRMTPDFISAKIQRQLKDGNVYPCMGCRSFLTSEKGIRKEDGSQKFYGRLTA